MSNAVKSRACAVCGSEWKSPLFEQKFDTVGLVTGYTVVVCEQCGFAYADGIPSQSAFEQYYRDLSKYEYQQREGRESESDQARLTQIAGELENLIPSRDCRILEIGCASGCLLSLLRHAGFPNVRGIDPSLACAETAANLYGVPVHTGSIYDLPTLGEKYDFLILVGVLEHLADLSGALTAMHEALADHGHVYFDVPDCEQFPEHLDAPYQQFSTEHINFFSPVSLANLLRTHRFSPVYSRQELRGYTEVSVMPAVHAVFEKSRSAGQIERDTISEEKLREYIRRSEVLDRGMRSSLGRSVNQGQPIIVWGVGTTTQRLLATGGLDGVTISAFVDSNPKYQGRQLRGVPILAPEALGGRKEPILICSDVFRLEIERPIREQLGFSNQLLTLNTRREEA
jgi:2-polyprenyl-3-methyl-5-hydroxy-6-metoxy-1,4-benzoquinol methylase